MANEIKVVSSLECTNGSFKFPKYGGTSQSITQTTKGGGVPGFMVATTAGADVSTTGITNVGLTYVKNLSLTNFITYGVKTGGTYYPFGRILPGEEYTFRLDKAVIPSTHTFHVKADTANCDIMVAILNE